MGYQRLESFILANNFIKNGKLPGRVYLSRMIVPFTNVIANKIEQDKAKYVGNYSTHSKLKYLLFVLHDFNISNFLRFIGYWKKYGYEKHVKYASSVRLEVFR